MLRIFYVAAGGALGSVLRYLISGWTYRYCSGLFPWGTLVVNLSGSLAIGFLWGLFEASVVSPNVRMFVFMGILGAFTTFSTFSLESFSLLREEQYGLLAWNILLSVVLGIGFVFAGYFCARSTINILR